MGALLALQAFLFNNREDNPDIYNALRRTLNLVVPGREESEVVRGHEDAVRALAVDGEGRLATGSDDGGVRFFESQSSVDCGIDGPRQRSPGCLGVFPSGVRAVAFSGDGARLAAGAFDGSIRVWEVDDPSLPQELSGHSASVRSISRRDDSGPLTSRTISGSAGSTGPIRGPPKRD